MKMSSTMIRILESVKDVEMTNPSPIPWGWSTSGGGNWGPQALQQQLQLLYFQAVVDMRYHAFVFPASMPSHWIRYSMVQ